MKIQRNIIYTTVIGSIVSALIYAYCVFQWNPVVQDKWYNWHTYISNMILGVWGSLIISLILGIVSYSECRRKDLEAFIVAQRALFVHCSYFKEKNSVEWFDEYGKLYEELSDSWSNIWFLFDPLRRRLFLKECVDYYGDFIQLTQDKYRILKQKCGIELEQSLLNEIEGIVIEKQFYKQGSTSITIESNRLTSDMHMITKNIDNIYRNKKSFRRYFLGKTLLSDKNFKKLDKIYEEKLKRICIKMDKLNNTEVDFKMSVTDAEYLMGCGYLSGYTHGELGYTSKIECNFITDHYFDMKKRYKRYFDNKR